jgi:hypothetical protein
VGQARTAAELFQLRQESSEKVVLNRSGTHVIELAEEFEAPAMRAHGGGMMAFMRAFPLNHGLDR